MRETGLALAARRFVREHERGLVVAWCLGVLLLFAVLFGWGIGLRGAERVVDGLESRWIARIDECQALMERGEFREAALRLERLDAEFPARNVKHRLDRERERLLSLLVGAWTREDRKGRALEAAARLVSFDPRNWKNHRVEAETARAFGEGDLARQALDLLLAIHPTHLPSVEERIALAYDGSRFAEVPPLWSAYLEAHVIAALDLVCGEARAAVEVPADGRPHRFVVPLPLPPGADLDFQVHSNGWSIDVALLEFVPPLLSGGGTSRAPLPVGPAPWTATGAEERGLGAMAALEPRSSLRRGLTTPAAGVSELVLEITVYKACTASLWERVEQSYENRLLWQELEQVRARTRVGGTLEAGSLFVE
ncbi:MAG: hypothetical protein IPK67_03175 [Planctomycetes bacterium]|jgi:hypothetical protein|nr:hypothetical protein [Planctomycetota bacterium]